MWTFLNGSPLFQLTETQSESSYYSPQKVKSREVLCLEQEGITIEVRHLFQFPKAIAKAFLLSTLSMSKG